jgi:hypothetical protein
MGGMGGGNGATAFFTSAECRNTTLAMAQAMSSIAAPTGSAAGEDPFAELAASLDAAKEVAPNDIEGDLETLAAGFMAFATAIEDAGGWNPALGNSRRQLSCRRWSVSTRRSSLQLGIT